MQGEDQTRFFLTRSRDAGSAQDSAQGSHRSETDPRFCDPSERHRGAGNCGFEFPFNCGHQLGSTKLLNGAGATRVRNRVGEGTTFPRVHGVPDANYTSQRPPRRASRVPAQRLPERRDVVSQKALRGRG